MDGAPGARAAAALAAGAGGDTPPRETSTSPYTTTFGGRPVSTIATAPVSGFGSVADVSGIGSASSTPLGSQAIRTALPASATGSAGSMGIRPLSGARPQVQGAVSTRASYESALLQAMRRQMEAFEEKVASQVAKLQGQNERWGQATLARLEDKIASTETMAPKIDRRMAEMGGNFKGISEEMQAQIRRVDSLDDRIWDSQQQVKEELRQKCKELDEHVQKVSSTMKTSKAADEDTQKRVYQKILRLEQDATNRVAAQEDNRSNFEALLSRLEAIEDAQQETALALAMNDSSGGRNGAAGKAGSMGGDGSASAGQLAMIEQRLNDLSSQTERVFQDTHDVHTRLAAQETQLGTLRTLLENREDQLKKLAEKVDRGDWEGKLEQVQKAFQEESNHRISQQERVELFISRAEHHEGQVEELRGAHERLSQWQRSKAGGGVDGSLNVSMLGQEDDPTSPNSIAQLGQSMMGGGLLAEVHMEELRSRVRDTEARVADLQNELNLARAEGFGASTAGGASASQLHNVAVQVGDVSMRLQELLPKVEEHERLLGDVVSKQAAEPSVSTGASVEEMQALKTELEGKLDASSFEGLKSEVQDKANAGSLEALRIELQATIESLASEVRQQDSGKLDNSAMEALRTETRAAIDSLSSEVRQQSSSGIDKADVEALRRQVEDSSINTEMLQALQVRMESMSFDTSTWEALRQEIRGSKVDQETIQAIKSQLEGKVDAASLEAVRQEVREAQGSQRGAGTATLDAETLGALQAAVQASQKGVEAATAVEALRQELAGKVDASVIEALRREVQEAPKMDAGTLGALQAAVHASQRGVEAATTVEALKQELESLKGSQLDASSLEGIQQAVQAAQQGAAALETLRQELQTGKADASALEALREELKSCKGVDASALEELRSELQAKVESAQSIGGQVKDLSSEMEASNVMIQEGVARAQDVADRAQSKSTALESEISELREALSSLRSAGGAGAEAELADLRRQLETLSTQSTAAAASGAEQGAIQEEVRELKAELASLKTATPGKPEELEGILSDIDALKRSAGEQTVMSGTLAGLEALKDDVSELKTAGVLTQLSSLKGDIADLRDSTSKNTATSDVAVLANQLAATRSEDAACMKRLETDVLSLRAKLDTLAVPLASGSVDDGRFQKLAELALTVKEDEAAEDQVHQRLLGRIGDICDRLAEVDGAVAGMGSPDAAKSLAAQQGTSPTLSPEFTEKFTELMSRVEEMGSVERQIQDQFCQFSSRFKTEAASAAAGESST